MAKRLLHNRNAVSVIVLLYLVLFIWGYATWTYPTFSYMGFSFEWKSGIRLLAVGVVCLLPMLWVPLKNSRPSIVIYWLLYLMTYIPMIVGVGLARQFTTQRVLEFWGFALLAFFLTGVFYFLPRLKIRRIVMPKYFFFGVFFAVVALLVTHIIVVYGDSLSFVSPFDSSLYDKRAEGSETGSGTAVGYSIMWLAGAFFPFLLTYGLWYKKYIYAIIAALGLLFVYMTQADKAFLFSVAYILVFYWIYRKTRYLGPAFALLMIAVLFFVAMIDAFGLTENNPTLFLLTGIILVRFVAVSAYTATIYYDFFDGMHPYTYYSHVNVINKFVAYPYNDIIGKEVGATVMDVANFNANANFYITDGLVALGPAGMPIAGVVCGAVLYIIDSVAKKFDTRFATLAIIYSSVVIMNASIFTAVLSGGLLWLFIFFYFLKVKPVTGNLLNWRLQPGRSQIVI